MGGAADTVASYLEGQYTDGASLAEALRVAVASLGHSEKGDRVIPAEDLEVAVLDRTRSQDRKFSRIRPARLSQLLGDRGPEVADEAKPDDGAPGGAPGSAGVDNPADPTDQVSGSVPPLEDPTTGEPPTAPPLT